MNTEDPRRRRETKKTQEEVWREREKRLDGLLDKDGAQAGEQERDGAAPSFQEFEEFVKKIAAVPKEELNEKLAEVKREKKEKRAG